MKLIEVNKKLIIEVDRNLLDKWAGALKEISDDDDLTVQNFILNLDLILKDSRDY